MDTTQTTNPPLPLGQKGQQIDKISTNHQARFFVVHRKEGSFATVSPFLIHRGFTQFIGEVKNIKKLRSGDLLVEVLNSYQASKMLKIGTFQEFPVVVSAHGSLNFSRGVISEGELLYVSDEEILHYLKEQHVCGVRRITIRRDGEILPTKHIILTFDSPSLPSHIKAGYLRCAVRPFVPNPLRCFKCQRFGHSQASCRGSATCPRCADVGHDGEGCQGAVKCANCKGDHTAFSRACPKWILEKEIQALKVKNNISYPEARKIMEARTPKSGLSYAAVVKTYSTIATQTDCVTLENSKENTKDKLTATNQPISPQKNVRSKNPVADREKHQPTVEKSAPLSVKTVFKQRPLNKSPSNSSVSSSKLQKRKPVKQSEKCEVTPVPGWKTANFKKYEKKKLKNIVKNYHSDPPLELYTSDVASDDDDAMEDEPEAASASPLSLAGDGGCGNTRGPD